MNKLGTPAARGTGRFLAGVGASVLALAIAGPALAQDAADQAGVVETDTTEDDANGIIVTGTRIRSPNLDSPVPVTSITGEEFFETGTISIGDTLNDLPALRSTFSQQNSTRFLGTGGLNLLDLRGLGTSRTLVLVNGRRHVGSDILGDGTSVDVNSIPSELIERVDLVTGGESAVYGSDAIAGVVNFVLKDDYEGVQLRAQNGISTYGDLNEYFISGVAGKNFADGRGNVTVAVEYAHQDDLYSPDRPFTRKQSGYLRVDSDPLGTPNGSDGTPDRVFVEDFRYGYYDDGGTIFAFGPQGLVPFLFRPDGSVTIQTGERFPIIGFGVPVFVGGNGTNFAGGTQSGLMPELDRYNVNLLSHFEISPAATVFLEAKYSRADALSNNSGPFFTYGTGSPRENFYTSNPFLTPETANFIRGIYGDYYNSYGSYVTGGDGTPDTDQFGFGFYRSVTDLGNREEKAKRETYRVVGGVRGDISDNWNYEASLNYGVNRNRTKLLGNVNTQRYLLAIDAVDQGLYENGVANGNIVCRSTIDPTAAVPFEYALDPAFAAAQLAKDVAECQPANLFGQGNLSAAARDYIVQDTMQTGKITQFVANAFVSGDTTGFFELPGGPVGIALGAEYRKETLEYRQDAFTNAGLTFYNALPPFDPPSFEVKEAFAEIRLPLLAERPFFEELTASAAARVSDYKGGTGTVVAYNGNLTWAPVDDLKFRAGYSKSIRAPNLADQYTPLGTNYTQLTDPCSEVNINEGSPNREANCRADGVPNGYNYIYTQSLEYRSGGNQNLGAETGKSITIGAIFQPRFVPGLSLSADYFDITVDDVITSPSAQQIVDACYDAADIDNQFCDTFERAGAGGGPRGEQQGRILEGNLRATLLNYAKLKVRGLDFVLNYRTPLDFVGAEFNARVNYTHMLQNDAYLDPTDPDYADQIMLELGDPQDEVNSNFSLDFGKFTLGYQLRYIGKQVLNEYEDVFSKDGRPPENADYAEDVFYKEIFYNDFRGEFEVDDRFSFYGGVDNAFNVAPPQGLTGQGGFSGIYDIRGRYFYVGAVAKF